jgi:hypothetical protein
VAETVFRPDTNSALEEELKASLVDGYLPCAVAFKLARELKVAPREVGETANKLKVRIISCQLGCFKLEKATHNNLGSMPISRTLAEGLKASLVDGHLPCAVAFELAGKLKVTRKEVGDAATKLKIRIVSCQLGCFP